MVNEKITTIDGKVLEADDIISFGGDPKCFARVGNDLYYKEDIEGRYSLLKKNYCKNVKQG